MEEQISTFEKHGPSFESIFIYILIFCAGAYFYSQIVQKNSDVLVSSSEFEVRVEFKNNHPASIDLAAARSIDIFFHSLQKRIREENEMKSMAFIENLNVYIILADEFDDFLPDLPQDPIPEQPLPLLPDNNRRQQSI